MPFVSSGLLRQEHSCLYLSLLWGGWDGSRHKPDFPPPGLLSRYFRQVSQRPNSTIPNCFRQIPQSLSKAWSWGGSGPGCPSWVLSGTISFPLQHTSSSGATVPAAAGSSWPRERQRGWHCDPTHSMSSSAPDFQTPESVSSFCQQRD